VKRRTKLLIGVSVVGAIAIGIVTTRAVGGGAETEVGAEAPTLGPSDVPVRLSPSTVELDAESEQAFRETWTREPRSPFAVNTTPGADSVIKAHGRTAFGNGVWWITTYRNVDGLFCYGERLGSGGQGLGCTSRDNLFRDGPLFVASGRRQAGDPTRWNVFWIYGFTKAPVESVEIMSTDCSRTDVDLDSDGVFLHLVGPAKIDKGVWPYKVVARDRNGAVVGEKALPLQAPDTPPAVDAGVKAPRPRDCT
jgi:hypothetical protein